MKNSLFSPGQPFDKGWPSVSEPFIVTSTVEPPAKRLRLAYGRGATADIDTISIPAAVEATYTEPSVSMRSNTHHQNLPESATFEVDQSATAKGAANALTINTPLYDGGIDDHPNGRTYTQSHTSTESAVPSQMQPITNLNVQFDTPLSFPLSNRIAASVASNGGVRITESLSDGRFDEQGTAIIEALISDGAFEIQVSLSPLEQALIRERLRKCTSQSNTLLASLIIYGPLEAFDAVGTFFQDCELYLQDPIGCDRNIPYHNPHRLTSPSSPPRMTFDFDSPSVHPKVTRLRHTDLLDVLTSSMNLPEAQTPSLLRTPLLRHQRQALYFMVQRESGWAYDEPEADIWTRQTHPEGNLYVNNVTGKHQIATPPTFRGGILADAMGLGKSCSMIALVANDSDVLSASSSRIKVNEILRSPEVSTTLLIVPLPLMQAWEEQIQKHVHPGSPFKVRRHHASRRITAIEQLHGYNIILTTYQTIETEWRMTSSGKPSLLFSLYWRRIILDEAHFVSDPSTSTARALFALQAQARWAVTGTPLQNRLGDISTLCQFLRVYPYDNPKVFDFDVIQAWRAGSESEAIARLKRLLRYILVRRATNIIHLPSRTDLMHTLQFSSEEREHYDTIEGSVATNIDAVLGRSKSRQSTYLNVLQLINELRLLCNLGLQRPSKRVAISDVASWDTAAAQKAFITLASTDALSCHICSLSPDASYDSLGLCSELAPLQQRHQLHSCLRFVCAGCIHQISEPTCGHVPVCSKAFVTHMPGMTTPSAVSPLGPLDDIDARSLPTKIEALIKDLLFQLPGTKSIVFSYWTTTLDLIEKGLSQALIAYTRYDGSTSSQNRTLALKKFRENANITVILMTISCASVGLDITAACRAYIMEPQWNPTIEEQALARIHRMGQTKEVTTIRYVIENTFEQHVIDRQERKRKLAELLLSPDQHHDGENSLEGMRYYRSLLR
ncbi:hypothetical protein CC80DRAFT_552277 [Byssothecium circinans]|uniref:Uncharacterized protein n=1 Tax=Byssothecium circinans TaxID=147558 RepID=A0A6A5TJB1_9PLEO|nr:hypothetical protein CC80DRAFT_552277 [Byssothecium circinans]